MIDQSSLRSCLVIVLFAAFVPPSSISAQESSFISSDPVRFTVLQQDLEELLIEFGANFNVSMTIDDEVYGRVSNLQGTMSPSGFLDRLASAHGLSWYYDGSSVHVTPASQNRSVVVDFRKVSPELLNETLASLGVADPRFQVRATDEKGIGVLTGPPRYIELVENAFALLEQRLATRNSEGSQIAKEPAVSNILIIRGDSAQVWRGKNALGDEASEVSVNEDSDTSTDVEDEDAE